MAKDYKPECWSDDMRMNVLFSPFRAKEVNPQDWEGKLSFWQNAIKEWCLKTNRINFDENCLKSAFERNGRYPQCLETVIAELVRMKFASRASDFGNLYEGSGWVSWGVSVLIKRPLLWSLSTLANSMSGKAETSEQNYVLLDVVKANAEVLLNYHQEQVEFESTDHVMEMSTLWDQCKDKFHSERDLELVLIYLKKEKLVSTFQDGNLNVVKFKHYNEKTVTDISEVDLGILKLKKARDYLRVRILKLQNDVDKYLTEAKFHLQHNAKASARVVLRKKKLLDKVIAKRETSLENLEELLRQIQDVESEKLVINAYRSGSEGFRKTLSESGITLDDVDETMSAIQEVFDMHEDIQESMSQSIGPDADVSELELELEELLMEPDEPPAPPPSSGIGRRPKPDDEENIRIHDKNTPLTEEKNHDITLPSVPTSLPSSPNESVDKEDVLLLANE